MFPHLQHSTIICDKVSHVSCQTPGHCLLPTLSVSHDLPLIVNPLTNSPMQDMLERDRQNASSSVARERARAAAAERDLESASSQADARRRQLQHDLDNAHSEVNLPIFCLSAARIQEVSLSRSACM